MFDGKNKAHLPRWIASKAWCFCGKVFSLLQQGLMTYELPHDKINKMTCARQRLITAWAQCFFMRTDKTLIRLGGCPGWSESSLGVQVILLVLSCCGSFNRFQQKSVSSEAMAIYHEVAVIQWLTSRHKNRMTTRHITIGYLCVMPWCCLWCYVFY